MATVLDDKKQATSRLASPNNIYPGNQLQGNSGSSRAPVGAAPKPAPAATPAVARLAGPSELYMQDRAQEMRDQWGSGNYAQAAGTAARTAVQGLGMYGIELADKAATPVMGAVGKFAGGLLGSDANAEPAAPATNMPPSAAVNPAAASPAAPSSVPPATMKPGMTNRVGAAPAATQAASAASASLGSGLPDGVYNHGRGQYSDQASGMGFATGFIGQPNAQNQRATASLAAMNSPILAEQQGGVPAFTAPAVAHSGNDWAARQRLKDMETSASSITNRAEWRSGNSTPVWGSRHGQGTNDPDGKIARFNAATQADLAAQGKAPELQQRTNEVNAGMQRAAMAEAGADRRAQGQIGLGMGQLALGAQRNQLDARRISNDERLRAPQIRAAERLGQLQEAYINAKTPEEQAAIASQMRAYSGKDEADWKVQVTPATKNLDGSTTAGAVIRYNSRTGDVQEVGAPKTALPPGMTKQVGTSGGKPVYEDANGKRFVSE